MREVAEGVHLLRGLVPNAINAYLVGDVLVDARTRLAARSILRQLAGRTVAAHAVTHGHFDHQGASHAVCETLGVPFWAPAGDADALERGDWWSLMPANAITRLERRIWAGPARPVDRRLREGDRVAGFEVLEVPGHSPGHIALWRRQDRVLLCGDVFLNMNLLTGRPGLHPPAGMFTPDPERNEESMQRLLALEPRITLFGHGPPLHGFEKLRSFVERLTGVSGRAIVVAAAGRR